MDKFFEERNRRLREHVLSHQREVEEVDEEEVEEVDEEEVEEIDDNFTVKEIKSLLDQRGIEYSSSARKDELLALLGADTDDEDGADQ